jgi:hypothetical protein
MKVLVDECVDERLRFLFPGHDCPAARFANLAGLKTGASWKRPRQLASMF